MIAVVALSASAANGKEGKALLKRIKKLQKQGVMVGHQDAPVYGKTWKWEEGRSDVLETAGDYPAVMGFDLGKIELGSDKNLDGVPFDRMRKEIVAHHERGGIVTLSWHPWNIATGENSWDPSGNAVTKILAGGETGEKFAKWQQTVADFINSLKTNDGKQVPVIFRPWHEMNGGWFWWGAKSCTPEEYKTLYATTYDVLTKAGCNVVWSYSPNLYDSAPTVEDYLRWYPGDNMVDMIGIDIYDFNHDSKKYQDNLRVSLKTVEAAGRQLKKVIALTETGCRKCSEPQWYTETLLPVLKEFPLSYVLIWRNAWDQPDENFMAYPGCPNEKDFKKFHDDKITLFVKDINK